MATCTCRWQLSRCTSCIAWGLSCNNHTLFRDNTAERQIAIEIRACTDYLCGQADDKPDFLQVQLATEVQSLEVLPAEVAQDAHPLR